MNDMNTSLLTVDEILELINVLDKIERNTYVSYNLQRISDGFATADMISYDDTHIYIELKSGVKSDCGDKIQTEQITLNRKTFKEE